MEENKMETNNVSQLENVFGQANEVNDVNEANQSMGSNNLNNNLKKRNGSKPIVFIVLGVFLIGVFVAVYFLFLKPKTAKQVFDGAIDSVFTTLIAAQKQIDDNLSLDYKNKAINIQANVVLDLEPQNEEVKEALGELKDIEFKVGFVTDIKNNEISFSASNVDNGKDILSFEGFIKDNALYLNSNVFTHPYKENLSDSLNFDEEYLDILSNADFKLTQRLTGKIQKFLKSSIKDEYLVQEKGKYTIQGHSIDGYKTTLKLNGKKLSEILVNFCELAINDEEFLKDYASLSGYTIQETKDEFSYLIEEMSNVSDTGEDTIIIDLYTKFSGKFLGFELTIDSSTSYYENKNKVSIVADKDYAYIKLLTNNEELASATYDIRTNELKTSIENINIVIKFEKNGIKISVSNEEISVSVSVSNSVEAKKISDRLAAELVYKNSEAGFKASIDINETIEETSGIKTFDVSNATVLSNIDDYQLQTILENVLEKIEGTYLESIYMLASVIADSNSSVASDAAQSAFAKEGMTAIDASKYALQVEQLKPSSGISAEKNVCMDIDWLYNKGYYTKGSSNGYKGSVLITYSNGVYTQKVWLSNKIYKIFGKTSSELYNDYSTTVKSYSGSDASTNCGGSGYDIICTGSNNCKTVN